jgi:pimeloyl-ACP methyl ester carboxylesterase
MRLALIVALALLALPAAAQSPNTDLAAYRGVFSAGALGLAGDPGSAAIGLERNYRGAVPHSAFAVAQAPNGRFVWNFVGGQASPEAARQEALARCTRAAANIGSPPCRIVAVNGAVEGRPAFTPETQTLGPFRASPLHFRHGPLRAQGVILFSHGRSGAGADLRNDPVQGWVSAFNDAGWDVWRYDRAPTEDETNAATQRLLAGLPALRAQGYRRVVLAGQSRGGWHSLLAAGERPDLMDAVIAIAPATHGDRGLNHGAALDEWRRIVTALPNDRVRIAAVLFREDAFDPLPSARIERLEAQAARRSAPTLVISPATGPADHGGGANPVFVRDWSACLLAFATAAQPPTGTLRQDCGGRR